MQLRVFACSRICEKCPSMKGKEPFISQSLFSQILRSVRKFVYIEGRW